MTSPLHTPLVDALEAHRDRCSECSPWSVCPVAARLLSAVGELMLLPIPDIQRPKAKA